MTAYNPVSVHDSLQAMCNDEDCGIFAKLRAQRHVNNGVCVVVCQKLYSE